MLKVTVTPAVVVVRIVTMLVEAVAGVLLLEAEGVLTGALLLGLP